MSKKPPAQLYSNVELYEDVKKGHTILAFDISSTCIGWALGVDGDLVNFGKYVFKTTATLGEKILAFAEILEAFSAAYSPDLVLVEEPLRRAAVRVHFEFLGVLRLYHMRWFGIDIPDEQVLSPTLVKKQLHVERGKGHNDNKEIMVNKINQIYSLALNYHPHSAIQSDDDTADAIALLVTWWRIHGKNA